jgi:hypothetical protein
LSLVLNFSPIEFDDREISVGRLPFGDHGEHVLKQLRIDHRATHVFRREGANSNSTNVLHEFFGHTRKP